MKEVFVVCPDCKKAIAYKNWFIWVLRTPFHWFNKRRIKCPWCGKRAYVKRMKLNKEI
jgi:endogenous inhibitor of DNA gyrase (YacG/DUF329 family)